MQKSTLTWGTTKFLLTITLFYQYINFDVNQKQIYELNLHTMLSGINSKDSKGKKTFKIKYGLI